MITLHDSIQQAEFDQVFSITRSSDSASAIVASVGRGIIATLEQLRYQNTLSSTDQDVLIEGFQETLYSLEPASFCKPSFVSLAPEIGRPVCAPTVRWVTGHWGFMSLCQAILLTVGILERAIDAKDWKSVISHFALLNIQMRGLAPAFKLAGDLSKAQYEVVRQRMMPPMAPEGFSGLWMADHIEVLNALGVVRKNESFFPDPVQRHVAKLRQRINSVYLAHKDICLIVAGKTASIAGQISSDAPAAADSLVGFGKRALKRSGQSAV